MRIGFVTSNEALGRDREMSNLVAAAAAAGHEAEAVSWEADGDLESFDVLVIRSTWNYVSKLEEFLGWARKLRGNEGAGAGPVLLNPDVIVRWNCHKRYLGDLARAGIPVVESHLVRSFPEMLAYAQSTERVVAKPAVGGGALGCSRFPSGDLLLARQAFDTAIARWPEIVVQPYLDGIEAEGEISLVVVGDEIVRGLRKSPAPGDWRVQREWGGTVSEAGVTAEHRAIVAACLSHVTDRCGAQPLFMRVDLMPGPEGRPLVSEIELIEPVLYADLHPEVGERLVAALSQRR